MFLQLKEKYPNRLNIVTFNQKKLYPNWGGSSSLLEAASLKHVMNKLIKNERNCTHILKVTGRYFLRGIGTKLSNVIQDDCILTQKYCDHPGCPWQNTEYYGMKKELLYEFAIHNFGGTKLMEHAFYDFIQGKKLCILDPSLIMFLAEGIRRLLQIYNYILCISNI